MATITYNELGHYNAGKLIFKEFDLTGCTYEEHLGEIQDWLQELTEKTGELCEEVNVACSEGVPDHFISDWGIDREYFEYQEAIESSYLDEAVFEAAAALEIPASEVEDRYAGNFDRWEDWAYEFLNDTGWLSDVPDIVKEFFDYEAYALDAKNSGSIEEHNGHFFWNR